jgi:hypothetical protein
MGLTQIITEKKKFNNSSLSLKFYLYFSAAACCCFESQVNRKEYLEYKYRGYENKNKTTTAKKMVSIYFFLLNNSLCIY